MEKSGQILRTRPISPPEAPRRFHEPLEVGPHYGAFPDATGNEMGHACAAMMNVDTA